MTPELIGQMLDDLNQFASFGNRARVKRKSRARKLARWLFVLLVAVLITALLTLVAAAHPSLSPV